MKSGKSGKKLIGCALVFGILIIIIAVIMGIVNQGRLDQSQEENIRVTQSENNNIKRKSKDITSEKSVEHMLAAMDKGSPVGLDKVKVNRFRYLLKRLKEKSGEDEVRIGDMTVTAQNKLREYGIEESLLNIMEGMNRIYYSNMEGQDLAEYFAAYITLRADGLSHEDAVLDLIALLESFGIR